MSRALMATTGVTLVALAVIDGTYLSVFARSEILLLATGLQLLVFSLQVAKTAVIFAVKDLRDASGSVLVDLYGAELLLLPVLLVVYLGFGLPSAPALMGQLIIGWMVGVPFAGSFLVAYRLGRGMLRSERLALVLPLGVVAAEVGILLGNGAAGAAAAHTGLAGVAAGAFFGRGTTVPGGVFLFGAAAAVYVSLLAYALVGWSGRAAVDLNRALALGAGATFLGVGWALVTSLLSLGTDLVFVPPAAGGVVLSWWMARGK